MRLRRDVREADREHDIDAAKNRDAEMKSRARAISIKRWHSVLCPTLQVSHDGSWRDMWLCTDRERCRRWL